MSILFFIIVYTACVKLETAVLILARGGSKGIPLKNLQRVGSETLLGRAIKTTKEAGLFDITVSTDHPLIALEALKSGVHLFHRSPITASDWAPSIWGALEFLAHRKNVTILILIQVTSPFTSAYQLHNALEKINYPKPYDCVFSAVRNFKLRWQKRKDSLRPINFNVFARPRRQDWSGELLETGAFYIARRHLIESGYFQNYNCTTQVVSSLEIITSEKHKMSMSSTDTVIFEDLEATDVISVELVPERKGLILKHCEYYVSSRRHGTTVTRRYNDFAQLQDVLFAKYPYRSICRLPPKRVVVNGGSPLFLQRRRAALQRWLTLVARHPVLAHDADLRSFLCEVTVKLDKPKHDEFVLAGTQENSSRDMSTDEMQDTFSTDQEQLRLAQLGIGRIYKIFERVEGRCEAERADIREMGAGLSALSTPSIADGPRWSNAKEAMKAAADLVTEMSDNSQDELDFTEDGSGGKVLLALDALNGYRELCGRLTRGLHAERAAAAAAAPHSAASQLLRERHRYALRCSLEEARVGRAYALAALESLPELFRTQGTAHARVAALWADLHTALRHPRAKPTLK
ncbi:hypothetical protein evm_009394 [Chilo suppressalis]|nr:hypothetical protein evm_009394 [Chilo suppressalis]